MRLDVILKFSDANCIGEVQPVLSKKVYFEVLAITPDHTMICNILPGSVNGAFSIVEVLEAIFSLLIKK